MPRTAISEETDFLASFPDSTIPGAATTAGIQESEARSRKITFFRITLFVHLELSWISALGSLCYVTSSTDKILTYYLVEMLTTPYP